MLEKSDYNLTMHQSVIFYDSIGDDKRGRKRTRSAAEGGKAPKALRNRKKTIANTSKRVKWRLKSPKIENGSKE